MTDGEDDRLTSLLKRCVSIDLEVSKPRCPEDKGQIQQLAIVRGDTGLAFKRSISGGAITPKTTEEFCQGADFVLGHNIVAFDIPYLNDEWPDCTVQSKPAIDTLRLSPLAFPRNPYHHLVKHYQDSQLNRGQINNPELDARLVFDVLREQHGAIVKQLDSSSNLVTSWHWLSTTDPNADGFDEFLSSVRGKKRPSRKEAIEATIAQLMGNSCSTFTNYLIADWSCHGLVPDT